MSHLIKLLNEENVTGIRVTLDFHCSHSNEFPMD